MDASNAHEISLQTAIDMTKLYRANRPSHFPLSETFEISAIQKLIAVNGCQFLRIYYGMKEDMNVDAILVAVNASGNDILPVSASSNNEKLADNGGVIIEDGFRCPTACPPSSPLNSD